MKKFSFGMIMLIILLTAAVTHADTLTVTSKGEVINQFDVTDKVPGDYYLKLFRFGLDFYLPWNGEDSLDFVVQDSVLLLNGNVVGIRGEIDLSLITNPDSIYHLSGQIKDYSLLPGFRNLVYFKPEQVSDSCIRYLQGLNPLRILNLSKNQVSGLDLENLSGIPNLHTLDLTDTDINDEGLSKISDCMNLEKLSISNTDTCSESFTSEGLAELSALANLRVLEIMEADGIGDQEFAILCNISNLQKLRIDGQSNINDQGLKHITKLTQLEVLMTDFHNQGDITDSSIDVLADMKSLRKLSIPGAKFSDSGWERLRDSLPECDIDPFNNIIRINPAPISTLDLLEEWKKYHVSLRRW